MSKITGNLQSLSAAHLSAEEKLITGIRVNLKGTALDVGILSLGGAPAAIMGSETIEEGRQQAKDAGIPLCQQMALGLTNKRIIIWKRSAFTGKPKEIIGEIPLSNIKDVSFEAGTFGDKLIFNFTEDKVLELESVKVDNGKGFADNLRKLISNNLLKPF
ncbi:hypothetical protein BMS3Abin03_01116 [bacterium BMS3Abin03]|nr:hypothetical protein BMS3Abin03_01116 [bacterium BMS3Abin03]